MLDRPRAQIDLAEARLADHEVRWVRDQAFPMIVEEAGAEAPGLLCRNLSKTDIARLDYYEGGFDYDLRRLTVGTADAQISAQVYFPQQGVWTADAPWSLEDWRARWEAITMGAAAEVMGHFGRKDAAMAQRLMPFFRARAWARQIAARPAPCTLRSGMTSAADAETLREKTGFEGFFRIANADLRARRFDGGWSDAMPRETFISYDAALVLPYDPTSDHVLLIEQFRAAPYHRGDPAPWVLEPIAGLVDAGEDPADTARREAREEADLDLGDLTPMARVYASPGYSTEFYHCFLGLCDLGGRGTQVGGLATEHEDIRSHVVPFDHAMSLIETGEINAGPLTMMLLWLATRRESLRAGA